jgi:hypothetical protein
MRVAATSFPSPEPDYWTETQRPLASLIFLLPLLIGYESAAVFCGSGAATGLRNGADAWMRGWLLQAGIQFPWILPVVVAGGLAAWHWLKRDHWRVSGSTVFGMLAESLLFALLLIICGQTLHMAFGTGVPAASICTTGLTTAQMRTISYIGAGLYEESLFRLLLMPAVYGIVRSMGAGRGVASTMAVIVSSATFAAAHYLPADASALSPNAYVAAIQSVQANKSLWYGFAFRSMAGVGFGTLFVLRGFGVTVGSHALYDVLVGFMASLTA